MIAIMLIVGYKLIFDPYRPEKGEYKSKPSAKEVKNDVPVQSGDNHDYIMENTFQKGYVVMELTPQLESGLVYVIKVFKSTIFSGFRNIT